MKLLLGLGAVANILTAMLPPFDTLSRLDLGVAIMCIIIMLVID